MATAAAAKKKLVVAGGTGFLGSRICKAAVARGWDVISISRSGAPNWTAITSSPTPPPWSKSVNWEKANILQPSTYTPFVQNADAVVHTMGILLEADYKGVLQGRESPISGLARAFSQTKGGSKSNPLDKKPGERLEPGEADGQFTYELMNRDTAIKLAQEASELNVSTFVFISAAAGAPILPARYITSKREAESTISSSFPSMRSVFMRPGFLYDSSRAFTIPIAGAAFAGSAVNAITGGRLTALMGAGGTKPLKADVVAEAVVEAIADNDVRGPVEADKIEELASQPWRRGML